MKEVGVRELKQSLSRVLRAVARGERVRVTLRGKPVADILPAGRDAGDDRLLELVVAGRVQLPGRAHPERAPRLIAGRRSASEILLAEREAER